MKIPARKISVVSNSNETKGLMLPATVSDTPLAVTDCDLEYRLPQGMTLWKVGDICPQFEAAYHCIRVNASGAVFQNNSNKADVLHLSNCHDKSFVPANVPQVTKSIVRDGEETEITSMAKKAKKEGGKIAFVDAALSSGKYTKSEIAIALKTDFLVVEKTARNTVAWCASTFEKRNGKKHKAKEEPKAEKKSNVPEKKAPKAKAPAKKKVKAPKRKADKVTELTSPTPSPESDGMS